MIFIDTSAFLAIENRRDSQHARAVEARDRYAKHHEMLVTSDYVLDESYTIIRVRAGHALAVQFGEALRGSALLRIEYMSTEILDHAWRIFKKFSDHAFSFTDCTSFALMEHLHIQRAFAFDAHFREYGRLTVTP